jgi:hypothetical protein
MHPTPRIQYRALVAEVAAKAATVLPPQVNGRIEAAVKLVLAHDVTCLDNGTVEVGSSSDPLKVHVLSGATCDCQDFPRAPEGWCKHRIAAGIHKRVQQEITAVETTPAPPAPLPEAAFSLTLKGTMDGQDALLTVRGMTATEFQTNLAAIRGVLDMPQPPRQLQAGDKSWCQVHQVAMRQTTKEGRTWWSHKTDQGWCKGR